MAKSSSGASKVDLILAKVFSLLDKNRPKASIQCADNFPEPLEPSLSNRAFKCAGSAWP